MFGVVWSVSVCHGSWFPVLSNPILLLSVASEPVQLHLAPLQCPIKWAFSLQVVQKQRQRLYVGGRLLIFKILWIVEMIVHIPNLRPI